jgi:hypothetical protein
MNNNHSFIHSFLSSAAVAVGSSKSEEHALAPHARAVSAVKRRKMNFTAIKREEKKKKKKKMEPAVVSSEWVRSRIAEGTQASKVVDCSWFLVPPSSPHRPVLAGAPPTNLVIYLFVLF